MNKAYYRLLLKVLAPDPLQEIQEVRSIFIIMPRKCLPFSLCSLFALMLRKQLKVKPLKDNIQRLVKRIPIFGGGKHKLMLIMGKLESTEKYRE